MGEAKRRKATTVGAFEVSVVSHNDFLRLVVGAVDGDDQAGRTLVAMAHLLSEAKENAVGKKPLCLAGEAPRKTCFQCPERFPQSAPGYRRGRDTCRICNIPIRTNRVRVLHHDGPPSRSIFRTTRCRCRCCLVEPQFDLADRISIKDAAVPRSIAGPCGCLRLDATPEAVVESV
jgi:hypothetical protein